MKYLSREDEKRLLKTLSLRKDSARDFMIVDLILNTGIRLGECSYLQVGDVYEGAGYYSGVKPCLSIRKETAKRKKGREIPLNTKIRKHLTEFIRWKKRKGEWMDLANSLFLSKKGNRLSARAIQSLVHKWLKEAGIPGSYSVHSLRHTFAIRLRENGVGLERIQKLLGHSSLAATGIYIEPTDEDLAESVESL